MEQDSKVSGFSSRKFRFESFEHGKIGFQWISHETSWNKLYVSTANFCGFHMISPSMVRGLFFFKKAKQNCIEGNYDQPHMFFPAASIGFRNH